MGRPSTKPKKLKDGFYLEVKNQGAKNGIKVRRDTYEEMMLAKKNFERTKEVKVLGEVIDDTFVDDKKKKRKSKKEKEA
ncbi:MAG: hypothetical protein CMC96_11720 [Flavobacteriales bacterium]|nr:hypothetical protein [Flavobacteriales bacterium]|tara:strand:- start:1223 stop:1459 length:237 start_codon:yes stop_codon:yes gene_type:complete